MSSFKFSLGGNAKLGQKAIAKAEEERKAREEEQARKRVIAEFMNDHGDVNNNPVTPAPSSDVVPQGARRHYAARRSMKSGPGTLDAPTGGFNRPGPPTGYGGQIPNTRGLLNPPSQASHNDHKPRENVYTNVIAKVSNLPPDMDQRSVEELFSDYESLKVIKVEKMPPSGPAAKGRPSLSMKVTFHPDAEAKDLGTAMSKMNDKKYLGRGYYLHLDRLLSSSVNNKEPDTLPFGARLVAPEVPKGFAPTAELGGAPGRTQARDTAERLVITVQTPSDPNTLKLIHQTVEKVILGGVEFEAALMQTPRVMNEERFAWLYDQRHPLNRYYRWKIYQMVCGSSEKNPEIFRGLGVWDGPDPMANEFACYPEDLDLEDEIIEDDREEGSNLRRTRAGDTYPGYEDNGSGILSVKSRALLMWLLTSVPPGSVMNFDIAPLAAFAVDHASQGMDEIVQHIITNVINPFCLTRANPNYRPRTDGEGDGPRGRQNEDAATLNALRIVSDIAWSSRKEAGRSWKYRDTIGTQLGERKVFEYLETLPERAGLGKVREASFRTDVNYVIAAWQEERLFDKDLLDHFDNAFNWRIKEKEEEEREKKLLQKRKRDEDAREKKSLHRKDGTVIGKSIERPEDDSDEGVEIDVPDRDRNDTDDDGAQLPEPNDTNTLDQTKAISKAESDSWDSQQNQKPPQQDGKESDQRPTPPSGHAGTTHQDITNTNTLGETAAARARRRRPKAEDMFASDEE